MEPTPKTYGITSPISLAEPRQEDWQQTEELVDALKPHGVFENEDELNHRLVSLFQLHSSKLLGTTATEESYHLLLTH